MSEADEYKRIKARVDELMSGGVLGDGVGPFKTAMRINDDFGTSYSGEEIHAIWTQGKPWAEEEGGRVGGF